MILHVKKPRELKFHNTASGKWEKVREKISFRREAYKTVQHPYHIPVIVYLEICPGLNVLVCSIEIWTKSV